MKLLPVFLFMGTVALFACNGNTQRTDTQTRATDTLSTLSGAANKPVSAGNCYSRVTGKDTVQMHLAIKDSIVSGSLVYKLYEKDSNKGQLQGILRGDTLVADYTFQAEGTTSVREVAFLIKDSIATEGLGNVEEKNGKIVFTNRSGLSFGKGMLLKQVPCEDIAQ